MDPKENTQEERLLHKSAAKTTESRGLRGSEGPGCEIRGKQEEASDLIDADCLLFVRDTIERHFVLKWINYCRLLT